MKKGINILLFGFILVLSLAVLAACGEKKPGAIDEPDNSIPVEVSAEPSDSEPEAEPSMIPWNESDEVLKTMDMTVDGSNLTLTVIGKKSDDGIEKYGVREIYVHEGEKFIQSILIQDAIDADGVEGIDAGYTECMSADDSAVLKDVNFDGYMDLEVCGWIPNNSIPYYYWIWNNDAHKFEYGFCLQLTDIDEENEQLVAWYKVENGLYYTDYYKVNDKNELELVNREEEDNR